jgi:hypothetical protein
MWVATTDFPTAASHPFYTSKEQDPNKLMALNTEIIRLLGEKKKRVSGSQLPGPQPLDPTI